jgi:hypothetical protein
MREFFERHATALLVGGFGAFVLLWLSRPPNRGDCTQASERGWPEWYSLSDGWSIYLFFALALAAVFGTGWVIGHSMRENR